MNAKKVKKLRKFLNGKTRPSWRDRTYVVSDHPKEKEHKRMYRQRVRVFDMEDDNTLAKLADVVPMVVSTKLLNKKCGRAFYKNMKKNARKTTIAQSGVEQLATN